jgi:hypothetical protein
MRVPLKSHQNRRVRQDAQGRSLIEVGSVSEADEIFCVSEWLAPELLLSVYT